jgi:nucleotide-binding universal stress UspA family protein
MTKTNSVLNSAPAKGSIVVGVDESERARHALAFAFDTARRLGVGCHVVHAWHYPAMAMASPYAPIATMADLGPEERTWLDRLLAQTDTRGVAVTRESAYGDAGFALVDIAANVDAGLLVVGSVGHGGIVGALLGSVSQYCVHHATCPVVVVPGADRMERLASTLAAGSPTPPINPATDDRVPAS